MDERIAIVKLGGSAITNKAVAFSYREKVVSDLGRVISSSGERVLLVHGGGSFGHFVAKRYGLSSSLALPSPEGVSETREAMLTLNMKVCSSLLAAGVHPYPFSPFSMLGRSRAAASSLRALLRAGVSPVTFGDVVHDRTGFRVLSGDTICRELCDLLRPARCIMVMDVEGVLDREGRVVRVLGKGAERQLRAPRSADATGGILAKVREALRIASSGTEVDFVSGFRPGEFAKALKGVSFHGTMVKVPSRVARS